MVALGKSVSQVREESRKAVEAVRQEVAAKAGLSDLEVKDECALFVDDDICQQSCVRFPSRFLSHRSVFSFLLTDRLAAVD